MSTPQQQAEQRRVDLVVAKLNGYVCESAVLIASAHKILGIVQQALRGVNDSAEADYMLARMAEWNGHVGLFADTYGKVGDDITFLKRTLAQ